MLLAITGFQLTTANPGLLAQFYAEIGFTVGEGIAIPAKQMALFGLSGRGERHLLRLGDQQIALDAFDRAGRPIAKDAAANDQGFQHLAIVTSDAVAAWALAERAGALPISCNGPVTLPASAGGVTAIKFRDPEGHPLEFLQFPEGARKGWRGIGIMGIDHSAICVSDGGRARAFYETRGLVAAGGSRNHGPSQDALDGLENVSVDVVALAPHAGVPHLELLAYYAPVCRDRAQRDLPAVNDVIATRIIWKADCEALLRDPEGHLHYLHAADHG